MVTHGLRVLALLNVTNYSMVVDQSDYSISTILYQTLPPSKTAYHLQTFSMAPSPRSSSQNDGYRKNLTECGILQVLNVLAII